MIGTGSHCHARAHARFASCAAALLLLAPLLLVPPYAAAEAMPTLRADTAIYNLDQGVLQYAFTFANPSDSVLYLDCQVPPRASMSGSTLVLDFDRKAMPSAGAASAGAADSAAGGALAGGPVSGGTVDPNDFPPQRIGAQQTFQGQRRLDRVLGDYQARPKFSSLQLRMAYYPERTSGDGDSFVTERQLRISSRVVAVMRRGKVPPPPKVIRRRTRAPG